MPPPNELEPQFDPYYLQFVFDASKTYPTAPFLFEYQGESDEKPVPFSPLGGIQAVSGQKKNGKTFFMTMLAACCLEPGSERVRAKLSGLRMRTEVFTDGDGNYHEPSVLYVDTEMEPVNTKLVQERIHWLCGWPINENNPRLHIVRLRTMPETGSDGKPTDVPSERMKVVKYWISRLHPNLVFIDGLRDLVHDFNDNAESVAVINELMAIAENENICIWNALHYNPRPGADDESKMRGHLGTELGNKVSDTFVSSKKKDASGAVAFKVQQIDARSKDVSDIHFAVTDEPSSQPHKYYAIPRITDAPHEPEADTVSVDDIGKWLWGAKDFTWPNTKAQVKALVFGKYAGIKNKTKQGEYINMAINSRLIVPTEDTKHGRELYKLNNALKPDNDDERLL